VSLLRVGDAFSVAFAELTVNLANLLGAPVLGHEQRDLVALVEVVEIHCACSTLRKREHIGSLSRAIAYRTIPRAIASLSTSLPEKRMFSRMVDNIFADAVRTEFEKCFSGRPADK
jgi:hypothetical protein